VFQALVGADANAANSVYAPIVGIARGDPSQAPGGTQDSAQRSGRRLGER
jgi:hypothetical protein